MSVGEDATVHATVRSVTSQPAWQALVAHHSKTGHVHLRNLFAADAQRGNRYTLEAAGLYLDYSKNRIDDQTLKLLAALAADCGLAERIQAMFRGDVINTTEKRSVLHVALRSPATDKLIVDGVDVDAEVHAAHAQLGGRELWSGGVALDDLEAAFAGEEEER